MCSRADDGSFARYVENLHAARASRATTRVLSSDVSTVDADPCHSIVADDKTGILPTNWIHECGSELLSKECRPLSQSLQDQDLRRHVPIPKIGTPNIHIGTPNLHTQSGRGATASTQSEANPRRVVLMSSSCDGVTFARDIEMVREIPRCHVPIPKIGTPNLHTQSGRGATASTQSEANPRRGTLMSSSCNGVTFARDIEMVREIPSVTHGGEDCVSETEDM